ncbi:7493_t:CDS:1, partial [Acaulospora colombiana]
MYDKMEPALKKFICSNLQNINSKYYEFSNFFGNELIGCNSFAMYYKAKCNIRNLNDVVALRLETKFDNDDLNEQSLKRQINE